MMVFSSTLTPTHNRCTCWFASKNYINHFFFILIFLFIQDRLFNSNELLPATRVLQSLQNTYIHLMRYIHTSLVFTTDAETFLNKHIQLEILR